MIINGISCNFWNTKPVWLNNIFTRRTGKTIKMITSIINFMSDLDNFKNRNINILICAATEQEARRIVTVVRCILDNLFSSHEVNNLISKIIYGSPLTLLQSRKLLGVFLKPETIFIDHSIFDFTYFFSNKDRQFFDIILVGAYNGRNI